MPFGIFLGNFTDSLEVDGLEEVFNFLVRDGDWPVEPPGHKRVD
jgi:hypothetical protein